MKKNATFKRCGLAAAALLVCLAIIFTCFTFVRPVPVSAEATVGTTVFEGVTITDTCDYGKTFTVPKANGVDPVVTAPDGSAVALGELDAKNNYTVKAAQVGNYVVKYTKDGCDYTFRVFVDIEKEYFLRVKDNGAGIPTYMKANDDKFTVPEAWLSYYDEDGNLQDYEPQSDVVITVQDSLGGTYAAGSGEFAPTVNSKVFLTYSAKIKTGEGDATGKKVYSKSFTINVQANLSKDSVPTLSVSGVTSDISVNRAVTLPKATATDSFDENVLVRITVTGPDTNPVKNVVLNKYGYAESTTDTDVVFDNDKAMKFYPTQLGDYTVRYVAVNDFGKTSSERIFHMTCKDLVAPVFEEVEEWRIPETWGLSVKDKDGEIIESSGKVTFSVPVVIDNNDKQDDITVEFRITDSDNSTQIVKFANIYAASDSDDCKFTANDTYSDKDAEGAFKTFTFNRDEGNNTFEFDFAKYKRAKKDSDESSDDEASREGTYTVTFRARDKAQNTSSKTYTIKLQSDYEDDAAPSTAEVTVPAYISAADKTFTVPAPAVSDAEDAHPHVEYFIYNAAGESIKVDGGEVADIEDRDDVKCLIINNGKEDEKVLKLSGDLYFYLTVTDKAGNVKRNTTDNEADYTKSEAVVKIVVPPTDNKLTYAYTDAEFTPVNQKDATTGFLTGDTITFKGFEIATTKPMRAYVGFEVSVLDPHGDVVNLTLDTFNKLNGDDVVIYVKNLTFKVAIEGEYKVIVRVFDVNNVNSVYGYSFNVARAATGGTTTQAASIGTNGSVNVKYKLHNEVMKNIGVEGHTYFVARQISGGTFSLMGSEFVAKTQGSYSFRDGYIEYLDSDPNFANYVDFAESVTAYGGNSGRYTVSVTDSAAPIIEAQDIVPKYSPIDETVVLPAMVAYTKNGEAKLTVKVTDKNGADVKTEKGENNSYSFKGTVDGVYTVTYTATYANASPATARFEISVGDVVGPEFKLSGGTAAGSRQTVGEGEFSFANIEIVGETGNYDNFKITKTLYDPSKEEVTTATVSGTYKNNKDKANNGTKVAFDKAGTYEVVYTVTDSVGNSTTQKYTFTVVSSGSGTPTRMTTLSTVLIIVAVVLLPGVIIYVVRFRKVKEKK